MSIVLAVELANQTAEPEENGIDHALMDGTDLNP
jgi:hypothetical protein